MSEHQSPLGLGECRVYSLQNQKATEITSSKKWSFVQKGERVCLTDGQGLTIAVGEEVIRIKYKQTQAYFIKSENAHIAVVFPLGSEQLDVIEYKLQLASVKVVDWQGAGKKLQEDLIQDCGKKINEAFPISSTVKRSSLTYKIGGFFGALNTLVAKPSKQLNEAANEKLQGLKEEKLSEQTKTNWTRFKEKTKELNHGVAEVIRPAKQKMGGLVDKIGEKFDKSENTVIKGIRNFGNRLKDSLNEGYRSSMSGELKEQDNNNPNKNQGDKPPESDRNLQ